MSDPDIVTAFVQINLGFHEARQRGDISGGSYCLGLHLACEANYFTKRVTTPITRLIDDLEWDCVPETVRRRLAELREHGFVEYDVRAGQRRGYAITVTSKLVYDKTTSTRPPHDLLVEDPFRVEVTSTSTSTGTLGESSAMPDVDTGTGSGEPPQKPPQDRGVQERRRHRKKEAASGEHPYPASEHAKAGPVECVTCGSLYDRASPGAGLMRCSRCGSGSDQIPLDEDAAA